VSSDEGPSSLHSPSVAVAVAACGGGWSCGEEVVRLHSEALEGFPQYSRSSDAFAVTKSVAPKRSSDGVVVVGDVVGTDLQSAEFDVLGLSKVNRCRAATSHRSEGDLLVERW